MEIRNTVGYSIAYEVAQYMAVQVIDTTILSRRPIAMPLANDVPTSREPRRAGAT